MERERLPHQENEPLFYDNEDFDAPEASKEDAQKLLVALEELKALLPKAEYFEQVQRIRDIEVADLEDLTLVSSTKPESESAVALYKGSDPDRILKDRLASISFSPNAQENRQIFFDVYPNTVKRREWTMPDRSDMEPTDDLEEALEQMAEKGAEWQKQIKEADALREATGMDFVSQKSVEQLLSVIEEYRKRLEQSR